MPKIRINEYDMTGVIQKSPISNIIYIPILTDEAVQLTDKGKVVSICYSRKELENRIGSHLVKKIALPSTPSETDVAATKESIELAKKSRVMYNIATRLIDLGFPVLVEGVTVTEKEITVVEEKKEKKVKVKGVWIPDDSINLLTDKSLFDIRFLTSGIDAVNNENLIRVANERQDCIALINLDETATNFAYKVATIRKEFEKNSSVYAAGFTPWFYSEHPTLIKGVEELTEVNDKPDVKEAEKSTGFEIPDIFKDSSLKCEKVRILYSDEDSYQAYIVYAKGSKKVDVSISSGKGITGDTILPYDITKKKWISTRNGDKVLMEAGSGKNEINCAVYKNDYIVSLNFENFSCAEAETVIQEADLSELKVQGDWQNAQWKAFAGALW